ncbi:restriction endonuclease subunit S [Stutzerimonas nitrititolerans]|uniref:restriction endonuclease subunit S n=1 Tax=Stutzerimonas nitrititolerans TaxID=2482751 RepID=UPI0028A6300F|nr:restriction endonuclease subunit S [Stutzerimonas nitrititolerans]
MSWPLVQIDKYVEKVRTWNPAAGAECVFQYVDLSSVDKSRKIIDPDNVAEISSAEAPSRARQLVVAGDVLVATVRPNLNGVAVVPAELNGATASTGYCVLRADEKNLHGRYLFHWVQTGSFVGEMMSKATGANYPAVSDKIVKESKIPLPPLPEQKRIAAILDKADAIRRKRQQAIQLADDFLRAVFLDMFGDPVTNPKGWKVKTLASITKDWRGGASIKPDDFTDSGFPVLHKGAIHQHGKIVLDESKKTFVSNEFAEAKKGSLVGRGCVAITLRDLVPSGPSIGLMADLSDYATDTYLLSQGAYGLCVKPEELHAAYLVALSNHDGFRQEFKKITVGSTQIHIRSSDLKELALPVPPVELQRKYGAIRRTVINFQKKAASGEEQGELFDSLSQKAFRGEL